MRGGTAIPELAPLSPLCRASLGTEPCASPAWALSPEHLHRPRPMSSPGAPQGCGKRQSELPQHWGQTGRFVPEAGKGLWEAMLRALPSLPALPLSQSLGRGWAPCSLCGAVTPCSLARAAAHWQSGTLAHSPRGKLPQEPACSPLLSTLALPGAPASQDLVLGRVTQTE